LEFEQRDREDVERPTDQTFEQEGREGREESEAAEVFPRITRNSRIDTGEPNEAEVRGPRRSA
jgi:hypothetical protein